MKIGLVTWYGTGNFGTDLQSYAFCEYLKRTGNEVILIPLFDYEKLGLLYMMKRKLGLFKNFIVTWLLGSSTKLKRYNIVQSYKKKYLNIYPLVLTQEQYKKCLTNFDAFFSGSDQIWNPYHLRNFYLLDFAKEKPKYSYASSLGIYDMPVDKINTYKTFLNRYNRIGIREKDGTNIVNRILGKDKAITVLDPTFLLDKNDWINFSHLSSMEVKFKSPYMLIYNIGKSKNYDDLIVNIRSTYNIDDVVVVNSVEGRKYTIGKYNLDKVSPMDFIKLLLNSKIVCTDSFHATALCINLNLNFINLLRFSNSDKKSQNSRIYDLLELFGLSNRIYKGESIPDLDVNYNTANKILNRERTKSYLFIQQCLDEIMNQL